MKLELNVTAQDISNCFTVMQLLRPTISQQQVLVQQCQGYQLLSAIQYYKVLGQNISSHYFALDLPTR